MDHAANQNNPTTQSDPNKKKPIVPILAALLVVAIGVAIFFAVGGGRPKETVKVPDVSFYDRKDIEGQLQNVGLKLGKITEEDTMEMPEGFVVRQDPVAGKEVEKGTEVDVVFSKGLTKVAMPDLRGMTVEQAEKTLTDLWLIPTPGEAQYSTDYEPGKVCAQSVPIGTEVDVLSTVIYATSLGVENVAVPDVVNKSIDDARDALSKAGLGCDTTQSYHDSVPENVVISQSVEKDAQVAKGTVVTLNISRGKQPAEKVAVPNIISYALNDAIRTLESAGLKCEYTGDASGNVVDANPKVGVQVDKGTTVKVTLRASTPVPTRA